MVIVASCPVGTVNVRNNASTKVNIFERVEVFAFSKNEINKYLKNTVEASMCVA